MTDPKPLQMPGSAKIGDTFLVSSEGPPILTVPGKPKEEGDRTYSVYENVDSLKLMTKLDKNGNIYYEVIEVIKK